MTDLLNNDYITVGMTLTIQELRRAVEQYKGDRKAREEEVHAANHERLSLEPDVPDDENHHYLNALARWVDECEALQALVWDNQGLIELLEYAEGYRADLLIPEKDFEDHIREQVIEQLGGESVIPPMLRSHIDWEGVAEDYQQDYAESHGYLFLAG